MKFTLKAVQVKPLLKLNLQFFAEGTHPFAAEPVASEPHPLAAEQTTSKFAQYTDVPNPLYGQVAPATPQLQPNGQGLEGTEGQITPATTTAAEEQVLKLNFGGREVPVLDPILNDLHKDYTELTKFSQTTNQELLQQRQLNEQYQQQLLAFTAAQQTQQPAAQAPSNAMSPERRAEIDAEYMERQYESKLDADDWLESLPEIQAQRKERLDAIVNERVNQRVAPIEQREAEAQAQQELTSQITTLRETNPDFDTYASQISELLAASPELANLPNAIESLYYLAKGKSAQSAPTPEAMLNDASFQEKILNDPQLNQKFMQQYQQKMLQQNQNLPNMMGRNAGTQTPMSAGNAAPRSLKEASAAAAAYFNQG